MESMSECIRVNGINEWMQKGRMKSMSEALARDCQVNLWIDKTRLPAAETKIREWRGKSVKKVNGRL